MKMLTTSVILTLITITATAQETVRQVDEPGKFTKHLTPGLVDSWIIDGEKGETIVAHVTSNDFDPVLELAAKGETGDEDKIMFSVDGKGSESRFSIRLPEKGEYKIRVHAFKYKGGGNYALQIRRFQAKPLTIGKPVVGTYDRHGKSYHYFQARKDQILIPQRHGLSSGSWEMLGVKGKQLTGWSGTLLIEDGGEHSLVLSGTAGSRYLFQIHEAKQINITGTPKLFGRLHQREMEVLSFDGKPGEFRFLEIETKGRLASRLIYAPKEKKKENQTLARAVPEIQLMPVSSKGGRVRYAATLGREGRYQLQLLAESAVSYNLKTEDPTLPIEPAQELDGNLAVGGSAFYSFHAKSGQLLVASLASSKFDPLLRLYNSHGDLVEQNDDGDVGVGSRIAHMVRKEGLYRLQVSSLGDGGGGDFILSLRQQKLKELKMGGRSRGQLQSNSTDFWTFTGQAGKTVLLNARSSLCDPSLSLHSPDGVQLASDDDSGVGTDSLLAVTLPKTGRYTVWISSDRGVGDYSLRLIDGD